MGGMFGPRPACHLMVHPDQAIGKVLMARRWQAGRGPNIPLSLILTLLDTTRMAGQMMIQMKDLAKDRTEEKTLLDRPSCQNLMTMTREPGLLSILVLLMLRTQTYSEP